MFELPIIHTRQTLNACGHCALRGIVCAVTDQCPSLASMPFNDGSLTWIWEMEYIGNHYGLPLARDDAVTLAKIRQCIASGYPVILLGQYEALNPSHSYNGNHWFCAKGFDDGGFLINDSLRVDPVYVSNAVLELSLANAAPHHFALIPTRGLQVVGGGMNLDKLNPTGAPNPTILAGIPYARLTYHVSGATGSHGNTDLNAAYNLYAPYINALKAANITPIMTIGHQTFGEGLNYPLWDDMYANHALYDPYFNDFLSFLPGVIHQWRGLGMVYSWWNEQDSRSDGHPNDRAVAIPAYKYGSFFNRAYTLIKNIDPTAKVITGGHKTGAANIVKYYRDSGITQADGFAVHPYGQGVTSSPPNLRPFGIITDYLNIVKQVNLPLYVTEFGILDQPNVPLNQAIDYARDMVAVFNSKGVKSANWFAYGYMDNGFPVVDAAGNVKVDSAGRTLLDPFKVGGGNMPTVTKTLQINGITSLNFRSTPTTSTNANIIGTLVTGTRIERTGNTTDADGYPWVQTKALQGGVWKTGWFAKRKSGAGGWTTQEKVTTTTVELIDL